MALVKDGQRLVTLRGAAGFGKTRLAHECGRQWQQQPEWNGVWFVELRSCRSEDDVLDAVATAINVVLGAGLERSDRLLSILINLGPTVVIVDNAEHLLPTVKELCATWLEAAPELRMVVTSREGLGLRGEVQHIVGPLSADGSERSAAVDMFIQRARAVVADLASTGPAHAAIAELVSYVDGNPLAIEVLASRTALLSPAQLMKRLIHTDGWSAAGIGGHGAERLWTALDESWQSLSTVEQVALTGLSVFHGGASVQAAESVIAAATADAALGGVDVLGALLRKSLIYTRPAAAGSGLRRIELYEIVRSFARQKLSEMKRTEDAVERHARWFTTFAAKTRQALAGPQADEARVACLDELDNLLAVIDEGLAKSEPNALLRAANIVIDINSILDQHRSLLLVRKRVEALVARADELPAGIKAQVYGVYARLLLRMGHNDHVREMITMAQQAAVASDDPGLEGYALSTMGLLRHHLEPEVLVPALERAIDLLDRDGWHAHRVAAMATLARVHSLHNDYDLAESLYRRVLLASDTVRPPYGMANVLNNYGLLKWQQRDWSSARSLLKRSLAASLSERSVMIECVVRGNLAEVALFDGDLGAAERGFEQSRQRATELGYPRQVAIATAYLAGIVHFRGDLAGADAVYIDAIAMFEQLDDPVYLSLLRAHHAIVEAQLGRADASSLSLATAQRQVERTRDEALPYVLELCELAVGLSDGTNGVADAVSGAKAIVAQATAAARSDATTAQGATVERLHHVRFAFELLNSIARQTSGKAGSGAAARSQTAPSEPPTVVGVELRHVTMPDGKRLDLTRRSLGRRIIGLLAERWRDQPGVGVDAQTLFEICWPGENVAEPHRSNRIYVAVTRLRRAGLGHLLQHNGEGYLFDPSQTIIWEADERC